MVRLKRYQSDFTSVPKELYAFIHNKVYVIAHNINILILTLLVLVYNHDTK